MKHLACWALTAILLACPLIVLAGEAADTFNKIYGEDLQRVAATPCRSANKGGNSPVDRLTYCGFRVVVSVSAPGL